MRSLIMKSLAFFHGREKVCLVFTLSLLFLSGTGYSIYLGHGFRYFDEKDYYTLGGNLASRQQYSHDGVTPTAFRPPGYPFFLSIFSLLNFNVPLLRILNYIMYCASIYLLYRIILFHSSEMAALAGAIMVAGYPVLFYTAGILYPQTFGAFLFLTILFLTAKPGPSIGTNLLIGMLFGWLVLTIPVFLLTYLVFLTWSYWFRFPRSWKSISWTMIPVLMILGLWAVRNYLVFDRFILVSTNSGKNLLLGNSPNTTPNGGVNVDISRYTRVAKPLGEAERNSYFRSEALKFIVQNKFHSIKMYLQKTLNYFNYRNEIRTQTESSRFRDLLMLFTFGPLLILFLTRLLLLKYFPPSPFEILLISLYSSSAFFYAIFFTRIRFRLPFDYLLLGLAAIFLNSIFSGRPGNGNPVLPGK